MKEIITTVNNKPILRTEQNKIRKLTLLENINRYFQNNQIFKKKFKMW